ncbi:MAG: inositol monophosphatase family protein [Planctomycetota bacterium]
MPPANPAEPAELLDLAAEAARLGGATLLEWRAGFVAREKAPADLVTDADLASQRAVAGLIADRRPDDRFVGEEDGDQEPPPADGRVCWVVDPLDGTVNYVHGYPAYATSVGVTRDGQLLAGAVYDPLRDELFLAAAGGGSRLIAPTGETSLRSSDCEDLGESLVAVSLPPRVSADSPDLAGFVSVVQACRAVRRSGSAALNLAYVAAGRLDAHWAHVIKPWDAAAGVLIAREAGACVTAADGQPFDLWRADYLVASTPELHAAVLDRVTWRG